MKTCTTCKETKTVESYHKDKNRKSGRFPICKSCRVKKGKDQYAKHRERILIRTKTYYQINRERLNEKKKEYYRKNIDWFKEHGRKYHQANSEVIKEKVRKWRKENPEKRAAHEAKRRSQKLKATPHWLTEYQHKQIELKYWISQFLADYTGIQHHVDHIHPLQGENICGLHVPENLQILTAKENMSKSNSY